jgi:DNA cross-link repair 1A protein
VILSISFLFSVEELTAAYGLQDLLGMGITSLGPRKKITHALGEIRKKKDQINDVEADLSNAESIKKAKFPINGNKLITQYFQCSSFDQRQIRACKVNKPCNMNEQKKSSVKIAPKRSRGVKGKAKDTPLWCCIPGTPFRVVRYLLPEANMSIYPS